MKSTVIRGCSWLSESKDSVVLLVFLIYFLDNVLLSAVVPILPDYLQDREEEIHPNITEADMIELEGKVGILFASKSLVQLFFNPLVGWFANKLSYRTLIYLGNFAFFLSSIVYAFGVSYGSLLFARGVHGIGSAAGIISGLSLLADTYEDDAHRSKVMGIALGGMAVGVLIGYPMGGVLYNFFGKTTPFILVASLIVICLFMQFLVLRRRNAIHLLTPSGSVLVLLKDRYIFICIGMPRLGAVLKWRQFYTTPLVDTSICLSTSSIATLEPCLPIWLRSTIRPPEWQIGTAFLPDSFGYLIGTNFFGVISLKLGRWLCAFVSHIIIAISLFVIPLTTRMVHLIAPHFGVGLGIAVIDASLMPLLAWLVEHRQYAAYSTVYSLSQTSVSLAYGLGPFLGGWLMGLIKFNRLLWILASINLLFSPVTILLRKNHDSSDESYGILERDESAELGLVTYGTPDQARSLFESD